MWGSVKGLFSHPRVMTAIAAINAISFVLGILWYYGQLAATPVIFWPVVPDCPLAAAFVAIALILRLRGRPSGFWDALAWASAIKYGIWTIGVIGHAYLVVGSLGPLNALLFWSHVGLLAEGLIYASIFRPRPLHLALPATWFVVNDVSDYVLGTHPSLPLAGQWPLALALAIVTTILSLCVVYVFSRPRSGAHRIRGGENVQEVTYYVSKMVCEGCQSAVTAAARAVDGVTDVRVNLGEKLVHVEYSEGNASPAEIRDAILAAGYDPVQR